MYRFLSGLLLCVGLSQLSHPHLNAQDLPAYALKNVILHTHDGKTIKKASIVWRNGSIAEFGSGISIPFDAKVTDGGDSLHVYPGFIDGFSEVGTAHPKPSNDRVAKPGEPPYDRAGIQPERKPVHAVELTSKTLGEITKAGFTSASIGLKGMMLPGEIQHFHLSEADAQSNLFASEVGQKAAFEYSRSVYPSTLMGTILKFRQLWEEASALQIKQANYAANPKEYENPGRNLTLEALYPVINKKQPFIFEADSKEDVERIIKLKNELGFNVILASAKDAWRYTELLKKHKIPVLVSLDLPKRPEWMPKPGKEGKGKKQKEAKTDSVKKEEKPIPADMQEFRKKQEEAYVASVKNLKTLVDAGLKPGFSSIGMNWKDFTSTVTLILEHGLSEQQLIEVLTVNTASVLGLKSQLGTIEKGSLADFAVFSKPISDKKAKVTHRVVKGELFKAD